MRSVNFGVIDNRFLVQSIGILDPAHPITLEQTRPLRSALEVLKTHKIGCIVIVDHHGKLIGIFSERDVVLRYCLTAQDPDATTIADVMTPNPKTVKMITPIAFALNLMSQGGFRHLPVTDDDNYPVGIISVKNILDFFVEALTKDLTDLKVS